MSEVVVEWSTMTVDVKKFIVWYLDYESRCNLRTCSKSDLDLVDSVPFKATNMSIIESGSAMDTNKTMVRLNIDSFSIWFIGKNNVTKVDRSWRNGELLEWGERREETLQESRYDVLKRHIGRFLPDGVFHAISVCFSSLAIGPMDGWRLKCKRLELNELTPEHVASWMSKLEWKLIALSVWTATFSVPRNVLETSEVLRLNAETEMTDEDLDQVQAADFLVHSNHITWEGVKRFIAKFLRHGKKNDDFTINIPVARDFDFCRMVPNHVLFRKLEFQLESDVEFEAIIYGGFSNKHGIQNARKLSVSRTGLRDGLDVSIDCFIMERPLMERSTLWPFTLN